ncbi:MAG: alcohol dehydrogenase catalytic domain-containing protein, partial [Kutzneria sp.]|nr:alcohol dehydrogenase catalytic domain-containing protein [Kutzneria sp.]
MRALVATSYGPVENLTIGTVPVPTPGAGQLLLRVRAAGVNPYDVKLVRGTEREFAAVEPPFVVGIDVAGTVVAIGDGVTDFASGDEVIALTFPSGGVAEYVLAHAGPAVAHRPPNLAPSVA